MKTVYTFLILMTAVQNYALNLSGSVLQKEGNVPIPYASVHFVDLNTGVIADKNGQFNYSGDIPQNTLIKVSAVGFETLFTALEPGTNTMTFYLEHAHIELEEFVVSTSGTLQKNSITNVEKRSMEELSTIQSNDLGEAISNIPSVYNLSTGTGISKPVIRGLSGVRIVTYLNGLRIENQQWGGDHGLGISDNGIGAVEIIKGPSSLLYGADALGGVLYLFEEPFTNQHTTEAFYKIITESNAAKLENAFGFKTSGKHLRFNLFGSYTSAADYQLPNGKYVKNSRYQQQDIKTSLGYHYKNWVLTLRYNFMQNRIGIPGHTHDSIFSLESFISDVQKREKTIPAQLVTNHFAVMENNFYLKKSSIKVKTGFTSNELVEFDEKFTVPGLDLLLNNYSFGIVGNKKIGANHHLLIGSQGMFQTIKNLPEASEMIIPNANINDLGGYIVLQGALKNWNYQLGSRYDQRLLKINDNGFDQNNFQYSGINYSAGVNKTIERIKMRFNVSSGFRPPHSSEMLINGIHHGTMRYEIGTTQLQSEKALQFDLALEYSGEHLFLSVNPYISSIQNYIYISPVDSSVSNYPVYEYTQDQNAKLLGGDLSFHYHPHFVHRLHIEHNTSFLQATKSDGTPLPLTPQTRLNTLFRYQLSTKGKVALDYIALQHLYFFDQNNIDSFETKSKGYHLLNLAINLDVNIKFPIEIQTGIRNLLNAEYLNHLSRLKSFEIPAPGRNFYVTLKFNLKTTKK